MICIYFLQAVHYWPVFFLCWFPGLEGDASWVQLGIDALRLTGSKDVLSLGGGGGIESLRPPEKLMVGRLLYFPFGKVVFQGAIMLKLQEL